MSRDEVTVRAARADDVATLHGFICELAEFEHAREQVTGTPEMLGDALFGARPGAEALVAQRAGTPVGFALFHPTFSTWECRPGLWLEDLYVAPAHRRGGVGARLLAALAALAVQRGCARLEWTALDWNAPALAFYAGLDAVRLQEWTTHRLSGEPLRSLAARAA